MKKYLLLVMVTLAGLTGCKKSDTSSNFDATAQAAADDAKIKAYIQTNNINATRDDSGVYYQVISPGSGAYPTASSSVSVNYTGKLLDGTVFDSNSLNNYALSGLIKGWQYGIPHINVGGRILLIIPSGLGYGNTAQGKIPANSVLVFTIDLLGFK
ncbi:FKBP-type peptidyl-prolyl cis-trans isomerase [Mucilaginibacter sp. RS28]|uniref:Peptidyl-prolyl cis-trans isomerase n=1 Tax=Mucilaginibacter straminoryzae TaxID=2932774 RepID=A0A9X1X456_9SPHI|nr:FKBP-type peptidyl-prolyl cis-trans isomerase [Mucilaginibacter straminoryzae]MCJ8210626.1 FKBP-type peptidyl-prolyl cis-trans isomerase [Mucilaginibacter straminoryzae]